MTISVWQEKAERARASLARLREQFTGVAVHVRHDLETIAGGALAGAVRGAFEASGKDYSIPAPGGMKLPPEVPASLLLLAIAYSKQTDASEDFHRFGAGVGAYSAGREMETYMRARGTKAPGGVQ